MTRNPNPTRIQDNNESASTIWNPSLTRIQDVAMNTKPIYYSRCNKQSLSKKD